MGTLRVMTASKARMEPADGQRRSRAAPERSGDSWVDRRVRTDTPDGQLLDRTRQTNDWPGETRWAVIWPDKTCEEEI